MKQRIRSSIPRKAREVAHYLNGRKVFAKYFVGRKLVGRRQWNMNGDLEFECGIRNGRTHGLFRDWHDNGQLHYQTQYRNGLEHGAALQWNEKGRLIGCYRMNLGTGADLWWGCSEHFPSEERYYLKGQRHGFERWWTKKNEIYDEAHFQHDLKHGIFRQWEDGKLKRGYPKFYIHDKKITKREYLKSAKSDATLPPYDPKDDSPRRKPVSLPLNRARRLVR